MPIFNKQIIDIIELFEQEFYVVKQDEEIKCLCLDFNTKQSDPKCSNCLGTGYRIRIKKLIGASQETEIPTTQRAKNDIVIARIFYIKEDQEIYKENLVIFDDQVFKVHEVQGNSGFKGKKSYKKVLAISKRHYSDIILENFNKIINKG